MAGADIGADYGWRVGLGAELSAASGFTGDICFAPVYIEGSIKFGEHFDHSGTEVPLKLNLFGNGAQCPFGEIKGSAPGLVASAVGGTGIVSAGNYSVDPVTGKLINSVGKYSEFRSTVIRSPG